MATLGHLGRRVPPAIRVWLARTGPQGQQAPPELDFKDLRGRLEIRGFQDPRGPLGRLGLTGPLEWQARLDPQVQTVLLVPMEPWEAQGRPVAMDPRDPRDQPGSLDRTVRRVLRGCWDRMDQQDPMVSQATLGPVATPGSQGP
jgi:hypothetical protein